MQLNFIDLFSGCGGLSCGLEMAGHKCLLGVDQDKSAIESFNLNHKNAIGLCEDIRNIDAQYLNEKLAGQKVDMVVGGPPCQGFSTVGKGEVFDERNKLFLEFVRIVKILSPEVVLFENVTGLLASKNKGILEHIFKSFHKLGYHMSAEVMSSELYGVPSRRRRTIIIGMKNHLPSFPSPTHLKRKKTVGDALDLLHRAKGKVLNHDIGPAQIKKDIDLKRIKQIPEGRGIRYKKDEDELLKRKALKLDIDWEQLREGRLRQTRYQRVDRLKPAPTIMTSSRNYYHPTEPRFLTAREAALFQSFPLSFIFAGAYTSQFRQIGNAVPPLLAKHLGKHISHILENVDPAPDQIKKLNKNDWERIRKNHARSFHYKEDA